MYFSNIRTTHLSGSCRFSYALATFGPSLRLFNPPLLLFDTSSTYCIYLRPSSAVFNVIWGLSLTRKFLCSWPALKAKFNPKWYRSVSISFCGVFVPKTPFFHISFSCSSDITLACFFVLPREKGRDLTQSYDKSPYTNRNVKRAKWQHKQRHKKVRLNSGCGPT